MNFNYFDNRDSYAYVIPSDVINSNLNNIDRLEELMLTDKRIIKIRHDNEEKFRESILNAINEESVSNTTFYDAFENPIRLNKNNDYKLYDYVNYKNSDLELECISDDSSLDQTEIDEYTTNLFDNAILNNDKCFKAELFNMDYTRAFELIPYIDCEFSITKDSFESEYVSEFINSYKKIIDYLFGGKCFNGRFKELIDYLNNRPFLNLCPYQKKMEFRLSPIKLFNIIIGDYLGYKVLEMDYFNYSNNSYYFRNLAYFKIDEAISYLDINSETYQHDLIFLEDLRKVFNNFFIISGHISFDYLAKYVVPSVFLSEISMDSLDKLISTCDKKYSIVPSLFFKDFYNDVGSSNDVDNTDVRYRFYNYYKNLYNIIPSAFNYSNEDYGFNPNIRELCFQFYNRIDYKNLFRYYSRLISKGNTVLYKKFLELYEFYDRNNYRALVWGKKSLSNYVGFIFGNNTIVFDELVDNRDRYKLRKNPGNKVIIMDVDNFKKILFKKINNIDQLKKYAEFNIIERVDFETYFNDVAYFINKDNTSSESINYLYSDIRKLVKDR